MVLEAFHNLTTSWSAGVYSAGECDGEVYHFGTVPTFDVAVPSLLLLTSHQSHLMTLTRSATASGQCSVRGQVASSHTGDLGVPKVNGYLAKGNSIPGTSGSAVMCVKYVDRQPTLHHMGVVTGCNTAADHTFVGATPQDYAKRLTAAARCISANYASSQQAGESVGLLTPTDWQQPVDLDAHLDEQADGSYACTMSGESK
jgi:hypothetical protein